MNKKESLIEIFKWLIGTVGLGVASICINAEIQKTELEIQRMEADTKLLGVVTTDVIGNSSSDSLELSYLSFVNTFITTSEIQQAVDFRIMELKRLIEINAENVFIKSNQIQKRKIEAEISEPKKKELNENEENLRIEGKEVNINELSKTEDKIASETASIDSITIAKLNSVQKTITPSIINEKKDFYGLIGDPITKWCKKGYYVEYNNSLRIGIKELTNQSITFNLKDIGTEEAPPKIIKSSVILSNGETYTIDYKYYRYQISLSDIGAAGKNPFTKAAYITVTTYKKSSY